MKSFGECKANQVRTDHVKNYVAHRLEQGAANATINRELAALKRDVYPWAASREDPAPATYPNA